MLKEKYYNINVVSKTFGVIALMSRKASWRLSEIAQASGLPKGTLQRILLTLCELGYVAQESKGGDYALTLEFFKIGKRVAGNNKMADQARSTCRQLMETVNETVNLCVAHNTEMVVVEQQVCLQLLRLDSIIGSSFSIFSSASGKAYCAFLEERQLMLLLKDIRIAQPELTSEHVDNFLRELQQIRRGGLGFDNEEIFPGVRCTAAPIFDYSGAVVATVGCSVPTVRLDEEKSAKLRVEIARAAQKVSQLMGASLRSFDMSIYNA